MIEKTTGYKTSSGKICETIEDARQAEIESIVEKLQWEENAQVFYPQIVSLIYEHREAILDVLTTSSKSRPRARKANGAKRIRKPRTIVALDAANQSTAIQ